MKKLFKSFFIITLFTILTRLVGFGFRIYLSRSAGAEAVGVYHSAFSIYAVLMMAVSSGIPLVISRMTAKKRAMGDEIGEKRMMSSSLIFAVIISIILCLISLAFLKPLEHLLPNKDSVTSLLALLPSVVFGAIYSVLRGNLWGKSKFLGVCTSEFVEQVIRFIFSIIFVSILSVSLSPSISVSLALSIGTFVSAFVALGFFLWEKGKFSRPDRSWIELMKSSTPISAVRVTSTLLQPLVAILLPLMLMKVGFSESQAVSLYGICVGMTFPLLFIPVALVSSLSMALVPELSTYKAKNDEKSISSSVSSALSFALIVSCFFVPIFMAVGDKIGVFFFGNQMSGELLSVFAWVMIPLGLSNVTTAILNAIGEEKIPFLNNIIGNIIMILCVVLLPRLITINALGVGLGTSMTVVTLLNIRLIRKKTSTKLNLLKPFLKILLCSLPTLALTAFTANILSYFFTQFFTLAISCSVGAATFFLLALVFKLMNFEGYYTKLKEKLTKKQNASMERKIFKKRKKKEKKIA